MNPKLRRARVIAAWFAIILTSIDLLTSSQVHEEQGKQPDKEQQ
jgi:hypothetical protein